AIQGALVQSGGQLRLRPRSAPPAPSDRLDVAGPLTLAAGVVHVDLLDYLPVAGDEITIATAAGGVRVDPAVATSYAGAAPGFSFEVVARGNDLVFRALSDAKSFGDCQASQLGSMATLSRSVFSCQSSFVTKGTRGGGDRCPPPAEARFARTYQRAIARSAKHGRPCGLDAIPALADDLVTAPSGEVVSAIVAGSTPGADKGADALH